MVRDLNEYNLVLINAQMIGSNPMDLADSIRRYRSKDELPIVLFNAEQSGDVMYDYTGDLVSATIPKNVDRSRILDILIGVFSVEEHQRSQSDRSIDNYQTALAAEIPLRILVAEDNQINQKLVQNIFEGLGYKPSLVSNGKEAVRIVEKQPFDIIFMDVQMPEMDGLEATRYINQRLNLPLKPVIIAMTAFALEGDKDKCLEAGMDDYISKPFLVEEIIERIRKWFPHPSGAQQKDTVTKPIARAATKGDVLDETVLKRLKEMTAGSDPAFFKQVIRMYIDQSAELVKSIAIACREKNATQLAQDAHKLKGSSLNVGAKKVSDTCLRLERNGKNGETNGCEPLVAQLQRDFSEAAAELERMI